MDPRRVLFTGTFDVRNYGDLLFPLIAADRLRPHGIEIVAVSPTGRDTGLADALPSIPTAAMLEGHIDAAAIMIGGGYIIHTVKARFVPEYRTATLMDDAYAGLWLGATRAATQRGVKLIWNAPGVLMPFPRAVLHDIVHPALRRADYLTVRDAASAGFLEFAGLHIVPDTAAGIAAMWPRAGLEPWFRALLQRKGQTGGRFMVVHVRGRPDEAAAASLADGIERFAEAQAFTPILLAIGESLGDATTARAIARHLRRPHLLLDDPGGLREIAAALAYASLYVGASLHGYVTCAAYGVPGVIVASTMVRKFAGFLEQTGRQQDLVTNWPDAFSRAGGRVPGPGLLPRSVLDGLDVHWARVAATIDGTSRRVVT